MDKKEIIHRLKSKKKELRVKFSILKVGLFGSYSTDTFTEHSDIDIIYVLEEGKKMSLKDVHELEVFFKNLFQINEVDLVNNRYMNPIIGSEIEKTVIYV